jgi:hypothetical protein
LSADAPPAPTATTCTVVTPAGTVKLCSAPVEEYVQVVVPDAVTQLGDVTAADEPTSSVSITLATKPSRPSRSPLRRKRILIL